MSLQKKSLLLGIPFLFLAFIVFTVLNIQIKNRSLPPGCTTKILPIPGGCFANFAIQDITVDPPDECIEVSANNCNVPVVSVKNTCKEDITVNGISIPSTVERCYNPIQTFYIKRNQSDEIVLDTYRSCLNKNEDITVSGLIDNKLLHINVQYTDRKNIKDSIDIPPEFESCIRLVTIGGDCVTSRLEYSCTVPLRIGKRVISPQPEQCQTNPGEEEIIRYRTAPEQDSPYTLEGRKGDSLFNIKYLLTKKQCD